MNAALYSKLSAMMFMEYAVWGAWMPVLAARLLGPLKMSGKQTGWIYATLPLASMISPLGAGWLADNHIDMRWILVAMHLVGAVLLLAAVNLERFWSLFTVMLLYSMCYAATIPLVNALMFRHLTDAEAQSPGIFIWAPVAWALVGYFLSGWRMLRGVGTGKDCLVLAGILSLVMAAVCAVQPATPPQPAQVGASALGLLRDPNFLIFILVSLFVAGTMQFYFLGTAQFMQDMGIPGKAVPGSMAIAQAVQAIATVAALGYLMKTIGPKWTLTLGAASWFLMYVAYVIGRPRGMIILSQSLHGVAYVLFIIAGQLFVSNVAGPKIAGSAQGLIILVTTGIGLFLGTQLAGVVMDRFSLDGKFQWSKVWTVPAAITLAGAIVLAAVFQQPAAAPPKAAAPPAPVEAG